MLKSFVRILLFVLSQVTATTSGDATSEMLKSLAKGDDGSVAANDGDMTCFGFFAATSGRWQLLLRRVAVPVSFSQILTPKISRYISQVLIL